MDSRQHAEPGIDVAGGARERRGDDSARDVFLQELLRQAVDVAGDEEVARSHCGRVCGVREDDGHRIARVRARNPQDMHLPIGQDGGIAAEPHRRLAGGVPHELAPVRPDG